MKLLPILVGIVLAGACHGMERTFQVTFQIVDDEGKPVTGAETQVSWENARATTSSERIKSAQGVADLDGRVTLEGKTFASGISYGASKEGHYAAWGLRYHFNDTRFFRWQPWNPTIEVVLMRKKNPVPMYAKRMERGLDILDEPYGYDMQIGDWVPPHGNGEVADFKFMRTLVQRGPDDFDYELKVTFSNPGDGIQRFPYDALRAKDTYQTPMLYEAPAEGYINDWVLNRWRRPDTGERTSFDSRSGYFFRVRTVLGEDGKALKALFGKIYGDFFSLSYYLNPDGTRNIEFDPKRNLLNPSGKDLPEFRGLMP